jgi:hypothetical protein
VAVINPIFVEKRKRMNPVNITLTIPTSSDAEDWFLFVQKSLNTSNYITESVLVNFGNRRFLETDDIVVLACILEKFSMKGATIKFTGGSSVLNRHLENIKFKKYWQVGFDRERFTESFNKSTLCLWKISEEMIETYSDYAKTYYERTFFKGQDLVPLSMNLKEVFNNIFNHSQSKDCSYIITQYFPALKKMSFSVCDLGIGIPKSIDNFNIKNNFKRLTDPEALLKSLEHGFTVQSSPRNRGFGLNNILELTESSNGELRLTSNEGYLEKSSSANYNLGELINPFPGTLIRVDIDTSTFEELDTETDLYDF